MWIAVLLITTALLLLWIVVRALDDLRQLPRSNEDLIFLLEGTGHENEHTPSTKRIGPGIRCGGHHHVL